MKPIVYRNIEPVLKDVDRKKGVVEGYFSTWGVIDAHHEEVMPGAYAKSLAERGPTSKRPRIFHLWQHNPSTPLSRFQGENEIREDDKGLFFHSKISPTSYGRDVLQLYEDGVVSEHSVGIQILQTEKAGEDHTRLLELKLWEGSTVTWGANENTPVTDVKTMTQEERVEKAQEYMARMDVLTKALRDGTYTDDTFVLLELQLQQVKTHMGSLLDLVQPQSTGQDPPEPTERVDLDEIFKSFKLT